VYLDLLGKRPDEAVRRFGTPIEVRGSTLRWSATTRSNNRAITILVDRPGAEGLIEEIDVLKNKGDVLSFSDLDSEEFDLTLSLQDKGCSTTSITYSKDRKTELYFEGAKQDTIFRFAVFRVVPAVVPVGLCPQGIRRGN
jgi:hypothetical protein